MHTASSTGIVWMASSNACIASAPNIPRVLPLPMPSIWNGQIHISCGADASRTGRPIRTVTSCSAPSRGWNVMRRAAITSPISKTVACFIIRSLIDFSGKPRPTRKREISAARRRGQGPKRRGARRRSEATRPWRRRAQRQNLRACWPRTIMFRTRPTNERVCASTNLWTQSHRQPGRERPPNRPWGQGPASAGGVARPGCSPAYVVCAAKDAARSTSETDATIVRNANVLQEKSSKEVVAIIAVRWVLSGRNGEHVWGEMVARVHLPLSVVSPYL